MTTLAPTLEAFFTERLIGQRQASPNTVAAYRDSWRLLLGFTAGRTGKQPSELDVADLDTPLIGAFLEHLEVERNNSPRTRNARLAAIRSFFRFAALRHPEHAAVIARVLAIPTKRYDRAVVSFLTEPEADAVLASPDQATWTGSGTRPSCSSPCKPGCGSPSSPGCATRTSNSVPERTCAAGAKKEGALRTPAAQQRLGAAGLDENAAVALTTRCSPHAAAPASAVTQWKRSSKALHHHDQPTTITSPQTRHTARVAPLLRHGPPTRRDPPCRSGSMARTRTSRDDQHLRARRSLHQGEGARPHQPPHVSRGRYRPPDHLLAFLSGL